MAWEDSADDLPELVAAARDAVVKAMDDGVIVVDEQGCILDMNRAAQGILEQPIGDAVGRSISDVFREWPGLIERLADGGEGQTEMTVDQDEEERVFEVSVSSFHDGHGNRLGRCVLLRDVTAHRRLEQALRKTKEAAAAANEAKSDFMSVASHEMRTPITSIKGYTDLLAKGTMGPINEKQADFLDTIRANADRIALLVSDLSDIARIESGRLRLELGQVDVSEVVGNAVNSLRTQIEEKDQVLSVNVPDDLPPAHADHERTVQVLSNLMSNAHKFTPAGGRIAVRARRGPQSGRSDDAAGGREIVLAVEDSGVGIRAAEQDRVFEKFYRSDDRAASDVPGSGLGLSIAASLVEMQGGRIWLESVYREGTTVCFTLPVAAPSSHEA